MPIVATGQVTVTDVNDARQLVSYIGASQSRTSIVSGSTYVPNYANTNQVLTPQLFIAGTATDIAQNVTSTKWFYQTNGSGTLTEITASGTDYTLTTVGTKGLKTLTIKTNVLLSNTSMTYVCELTYPDENTGLNVITKSEIEIVKVVNGNNGANAIIGVLSNESASVATDSAGVVPSGGFATATTTMSVYSGATDDSATWLYTQTITGGTLASTTGSTPSLANRTATLTAMSADTATVTIVATKSGFSSVTKVFTVTKTKAGVNPVSYWLVSPSVVVKSNTGAYTPSTITASIQQQQASNTPTAYAGRFQISELVGTTWSVKYTTSTTTAPTTESSKTYTPSANIDAVRVRAYMGNVVPSDTNYMDEQIIPIVSDGVDAVYAYVWTPSGNTIKNGSGTVQVHVDIYKGATNVTGTAFKWYEQDPSATVASGGDADGGAGWRLLTTSYNNGITGYTTDTITVPSGAVAGQEAFKCVATYNGVKYTGVTMVVDISDPILIRIDGVTVFKNGEGSISLKAIVLQAGAEIDAGGTVYTYSWSIYTKEGTKTAFTATGKSITVPSSAVDGVGNVVCEVSK